jgi:acetolactate synthase I/III small subunit
MRVRKLGIVSWSVGKSEQAGLCRLTLQIEGGPSVVRQCCSQIAKLICIMEIEPLASGSYIAACHALIRVEAFGWQQDEACDRLNLAGARLWSLTSGSVVAQVSDLDERIKALVEELRQFGTVESVRTGLTAVRK